MDEREKDLPHAQHLHAQHLIDELWPPLEPPPKFSARVLAGMDARPAAPQVVRPGRPWRWAVAGAAVGGLIAAAALLTFIRPGAGGRGWPAAGGELTASARRSVSLAGRAVAVAESGAELGWSRSGDQVRVEQRRGSVFYRVDRGGPFVVATPLGEVIVEGTCFQVDLSSGASGGPSMWVRVLEGSVRVRNGFGDVAVAAGESVRVAPGEAPVAALAGSLETRTEAGDHVAAPEERAVRAEARVKDLERALTEARESGGGVPRRKYFDFTAEEKRRLAERCEFRYAMPRHLATVDLLELDESFGLSPEERVAVLRIMEEQRNHFVEELRTIYSEVVGDPSGAATLSPLAMQNEISIKSRKGEDQEARRHIFDEWGGRATPPRQLASRPAVERFWRLAVTASDAFLGKMTPVVGEERARQITSRLVKSAVTINDGDQCHGAKRDPQRE